MNRSRVIIGSIALAGLVVLPASMVDAEGGNGRSFCSDSGRPTGVFAGDIFDGSSYGNAGEVVSYLSRQGLKEGAPGQLVRVFCDPKAP
jgi:hypothetical protein